MCELADKATQVCEQLKLSKTQLQSKDMIKSITSPAKDSQCTPTSTPKKPSTEEPVHDYLLQSGSSQAFCFSLVYSQKQKELYAFGSNTCGQLGLGNTANATVPQKITGKFKGQKIMQISCGEHHTFVLTSSELYAFGNNKQGQLGDGTFTSQIYPLNITSQFKGQTVTSVSCGFSHSLVLTNQNNLYAFGANQFGQLGDGSSLNKTQPVSIRGSLISEGSAEDSI